MAATLTRQQADAAVEARFRRNIVRTTNWSTQMVRFFYSQIAQDELDESFFLLLPPLTASMVAAKRQAALQSWVYLAEKAAVNGVPFGQSDLRMLPSEPSRSTRSPGFDVTPYLSGASRAASGQPLEVLNRRAPGGVKALIKQGVPPEDAVAVSMRRAAALIRTEVPLVARTVPAVAAESPSVQGFRRWRRVPGPGACGFCLALASRGAVYRDPVIAGGQYHANCRCTVAVETNPKAVDATAIHPDDLKQIEVHFNGSNTVWRQDLGDDWYSYQNNPALRPPDTEFAPLKTTQAVVAKGRRRKAQPLDSFYADSF